VCCPDAQLWCYTIMDDVGWWWWWYRAHTAILNLTILNPQITRVLLTHMELCPQVPRWLKGRNGHWRLCGCGAKAGCVTAIASLGKQPVPSTTCEPTWSSCHHGRLKPATLLNSISQWEITCKMIHIIMRDQKSSTPLNYISKWEITYQISSYHHEGLKSATPLNIIELYIEMGDNMSEIFKPSWGNKSATLFNYILK
jgi:hypothetical protein